MSLSLDEIIERLLTRYEVDDIIGLLDISAEELLNAFEHRIIENEDKVLEALDEH